jgi:hypothetical protein
VPPPRQRKPGTRLSEFSTEYHRLVAAPQRRESSPLVLPHVQRLPRQHRLGGDPLTEGRIVREKTRHDLAVVEQAIEELELRLGKGQHRTQGIPALVVERSRPGDWVGRIT